MPAERREKKRFTFSILHSNFEFPIHRHEREYKYFEMKYLTR